MDYTDRHTGVYALFLLIALATSFATESTQQYRRAAQFFCDRPSFGANLGFSRSGNADHYHAFLHQCLYEPHCDRCQRFGLWRCERRLVFENACCRFYPEYCRSLVDFKLGFDCCGWIVWFNAVVSA